MEKLKDEKTASTPLVTVSDLQRMKKFDVIILRTRLQPFKTHFTPNYALDWGEKYPKATYPVRKKREVHTFDIKEFVKATKKKKLLAMMNQEDSEGSGNDAGSTRNMLREQMGERPRPSIPQGLPMGLPNVPEISRNTPFGNAEERPLPPFGTNERVLPSFEEPIKRVNEYKPNVISDDNEDMEFDVDELVRKIDAKIAELEREEEEEREKTKSVSKTTTPKSTKTVDEPSMIKVDTEEENDLKIEEEKKEEKPTHIELDDEDEEDDDFFDDFFDN